MARRLRMSWVLVRAIFWALMGDVKRVERLDRVYTKLRGARKAP